MPPEVKEIYDQQNKPGAENFLTARAVSLIADENHPSGDFSASKGENAINAMIGGVQKVAQFAKFLEWPGADTASLIWINYRPIVSTLESKSDPVFLDGLSIGLALWEFSESMKNSVYSSCEWAMVSCTRQVEP